MAELKKGSALTKGVECIRQVEKCAWACTPNARGVGEIKAYGPEALMEMRSNESVSGSAADVLLMFRKMQPFWVTLTCALVVAMQMHLYSQQAAGLAVEMRTLRWISKGTCAV